MTDKPAAHRNAGAQDRRSGADRRKHDAPLPRGMRDRRRAVDSRKPDVVELDMSNSEWTALSGLPPPASEPR